MLTKLTLKKKKKKELEDFICYNSRLYCHVCSIPYSIGSVCHCSAAVCDDTYLSAVSGDGDTNGCVVLSGGQLFYAAMKLVPLAEVLGE